jgi:hypothetical protein
MVRQALKRKKDTLMNKIIKLNETEMSAFSDEERRVVIEKFQSNR